MIEDGIEVMNGQEAFNEVADLILGKDYYIADPLTNRQANPIILRDIKSQYIKIINTLKFSIFVIIFLAICIIALSVYISEMGLI